MWHAVNLKYLKSFKNEIFQISLLSVQDRYNGKRNNNIKQSHLHENAVNWIKMYYKYF